MRVRIAKTVGGLLSYRQGVREVYLQRIDKRYRYLVSCYYRDMLYDEYKTWSVIDAIKFARSWATSTD